jgi:hypothetical protein
VVHEYSIDAVRRWVRVRLSGILTTADLRGVFVDLRNDPRMTPEFCALIDLRETSASGELRQRDIQWLAVERIGTVARCAFVAHDAVFGMCRMLASYRGFAEGLEPVGVFRTISQAEQWLERPMLEE